MKISIIQTSCVVFFCRLYARCDVSYFLSSSQNPTTSSKLPNSNYAKLLPWFWFKLLILSTFPYWLESINWKLTWIDNFFSAWLKRVKHRHETKKIVNSELVVSWILWWTTHKCKKMSHRVIRFVYLFGFFSVFVMDLSMTQLKQ